MRKAKVAIIGPGNIGTDLMYKVMRSTDLEMSVMIGLMESEGMQRARGMGVETSTEGIAYLLNNPEKADIIFDATTAKAHSEMNAPAAEKMNKFILDLTPAAIGRIVSPLVNGAEALQAKNVNLITCGGQATTPIIYAIAQTTPLAYAEVITSVASKSAGPGTRSNIDEYTATTAKAITALTDTDRAKVMTTFNPAVPETPMRNTIYAIPKGEFALEAVRTAVMEMVSSIKAYVPGYELTLAPMVEQNYIITVVTVVGQGDFLPSYAGNLDIETASAVKIAEEYAQHMPRSRQEGENE